MAPVTVALFNRMFNSIVTCDEEGSVVVWDARTAKPSNRFSDAHHGKPVSAS